MNSLLDPAVARVLERLHEAAAHDPERFAAHEAESTDPLTQLVRLGEMYLAVSPAQGQLLYTLARGSGARHIVEFGSSFGISTLYLAAAARDLGGKLTTTEVQHEKYLATEGVLQESGLDAVANVLEGDARESLQDVAGPIDFVFLDGWKTMYIGVLDILLPKLAPNTLIVADNIDHKGTRKYAKRVRTDTSFMSQTLGTQELSIFLGH